MWLRRSICLSVLVCALLHGAWLATAADVNATTTAQPAAATQNSTAAPVLATTTAIPKINVNASDICKKCYCNFDFKQLDCSSKNMSQLFTDNEWVTLQNGDFIFETIRLEHNNITDVPQFPPYPLKSLYLSFNQITSIADSAFEKLPNLAKIVLAHNQLTSKALKPNIFRGNYTAQAYLALENMRELDLSYNQLHTLDSDLFEHIPNLESLILCQNTFHVIDHSTEIAIGELSSLKLLDLSYMELDDLPDNLLHGPRDLETLILSGNLLDELPDNMHLAVNLKQLVLDENPMEDFDGENTFPALSSLEYLSISNLPKLHKIGKGAFSLLTSLRVLVAADNTNLSYIDDNAFALPTSIDGINAYPPLEKLYLHNNNLSVLSRNLIERWDKIKVLDLRFNPWICNCDNQWLVYTIVPQINASTPALAQAIECLVPWDNQRQQLMLNVSEHPDLIICAHTKQLGLATIIFICFFIGLLLGIPMTLGTIIIYRRGCFGLLHRSGPRGSALYNRASFADEFNS